MKTPTDLERLRDEAAAQRLKELTPYMSDKERQRLIDEGRSETYTSVLIGWDARDKLTEPDAQALAPFDVHEVWVEVMDYCRANGITPAFGNYDKLVELLRRQHNKLAERVWLAEHDAQRMREVAESFRGHIAELEAKLQYNNSHEEMLEVENARLRSALEDCVSAWGDYTPSPGNSKAYKAMVKARKALSGGRAGR